MTSDTQQVCYSYDYWGISMRCTNTLMEVALMMALVRFNDPGEE